MQRKIRVGIIFGGQSAEHEISLISANNIIEAIDKQKYEIVLIGIDKAGQWHLKSGMNCLNHVDDPRLICLDNKHDQVALVAHENGNQLVSLNGQKCNLTLDVVFPVLHGTYGEDGSVQGLLKLAGIPFVGADILGSAVGMDKDVMKRLLRDAGIPIAKFMVFTTGTLRDQDFSMISQALGLPFFVKPANLGSSVGISKVKDEQEYLAAIETAFLYDHKIVIEEFIPGREIECSVLGNENPIVSVAGEIIPKRDFYCYESKYLDQEGALLKIPAELEEGLLSKIQELAIQVYRVLCCEGMARVDFFLKSNNEIVVNEINTIPGFTKISMYPKLWEASGLKYSDLIDRLIQLAIERAARNKLLKIDYCQDSVQNAILQT